jgi:hypothetical protein
MRRRLLNEILVDLLKVAQFYSMIVGCFYLSGDFESSWPGVVEDYRGIMAERIGKRKARIWINTFCLEGVGYIIICEIFLGVFEH